MAESSEINTSSPAGKGKKRRIVWTVIVLIPFLLLVLAGVLLLGMPNRWEVSPRPSIREINRMQGIIRKLTSAMVTEDGKMAESAELELTPEEINTLLTTGLRAAQLRRTPEFYYDAEWDRGELLLRGSRVLPVFALNIEARIIPSVRNGKISISVRFCRIGRIALDPKSIEAFLQEKLKEYENSPEYQALTAFVESLTVQNGGIHLRIRPNESRTIFPLLLNAVLGRR